MARKSTPPTPADDRLLDRLVSGTPAQADETLRSRADAASLNELITASIYGPVEAERMQAERRARVQRLIDQAEGRGGK